MSRTQALTILFVVRYRLLRYAPTNILLIRTMGRRGLGPIALAAVLATLCFYSAAICTTILSQGGPEWVNALVLLFIWNGFKMLRIDPVTLALRRYVRPAAEHDAEDEDETAEYTGDVEQYEHEASTTGAER